MRIAIATLSTLACVLTGISAQASAGTTSPAQIVDDDWLPELPDSISLDTADVATGVVQDSRGRSFANVQVTLLAWPAGDVMSTLKPGDRVKLVPVAKATSDSRGRYKLRIKSLKDVRPMRAKNGLVNFEIVASARNGTTAVSSFSKKVAGVGEAEYLADPSATDTALAPVPESVDLQLSAEQSLPGRPDGQATAASAVEKGCASVVMATYAPVWNLVGQIYIATSGATGSFTYSNGAISELGVGVSNNGNYGTWTSNGTSTQASNSTIIFPTVGANSYRLLDTQFQYSKFFVSCVYTPGTYVDSWWEMRSTSWVGGTRTRTLTAAPSATYCTTYAAGSAFIKDNTSSITWTNGVETGGLIGIGLSTKTGYSKQASVRYDFTANRSLCGTGGYPPNTPYQLVVK